MQGLWSRKSQVRSAVVAVVVVTTGLLGAPAQAETGRYTPGAPGIGDPYFPLAGNGGYDVRHYDLRVRYDPPTDVLTGTATISARATQNLSRFDLDFVGMRLRSLTVNGRPASWMRNGQELVVTPARGIPNTARAGLSASNSAAAQSQAEGASLPDLSAATIGMVRSSPASACC